MSADSLLASGGVGPLPRRTGAESAAPVPGTVDPVEVLAEEFAGVCAAAMDADEVAVALEASGLGDRIAVDSYGQRDVFALAEDLLARVPPRSGTPTAPPRPRLSAGPQVLLRSTLYLTPLALALGLAHELAAIPGWVTAGALVAGWSSAQGLAYLGHLVDGRGGTVRAARFLLAGFTALAVLWTLALIGTGGPGWKSQPGGLAGPLSVSLGELALFAAVTVGLVTRRERELVRAAVPCWITSAVMAGGPVLVGGRRGLSGVGVALMVCSLVRFLLVAYRPAFGPFRRDDWRRGRGGVARGARGWHLTEVTPALGHAVVGAAQAILLVAAVQAGSAADAGGFGGGMLLTTGPLLVGALAAEYLMLRHRARLEQALDASMDRAGFRRQLLRAVCGTVGIFTLGIVSALAAALSWAASDSIRGLQLACGVLLAGHAVVTLLLVTHGKLWLAAVLVGCPALFVVSSALAVAGLGMAPPPPGEALSCAAAVLGTALALGFLVAVRILPYAPARP